MKSLLKNLSLLSMGLLIYSCNEKISAELQDGASTTVPTVITPTDYYFRVVNNSPVVLNYVLHRTGANRYGTSKWDCSVTTQNIPLSNDLYVGEMASAHQNKDYDISCYMESEELALAFNGLSFKVEASKNTCEYIAYSPYSYYDAIPGSSTTTFRGVSCDTGAGITNTDANNYATANGLVHGAGATPLNCGEMIDMSVPVASRVPKLIDDEKQYLCAFDYSENGGGNGQNCDSGRIRFTITQIYNAQTDTTLPPNPQPRSVSTPDHTCGGSTVACVGGAIKHVSELANSQNGRIILASELNKDFSKTYELPQFLERAGNSDIVNFRRGLASMDLNYGSYATLDEPNWNSAYNKDFDPILMEKYAANQNPDNTPIIDWKNDGGTVTVDYATYLSHIRSSGATKTPYAADPFLGINGGRVNPFYTFYCLDRAYEIKSRIRMVVRDWDRIFTTGSDLELISDVYKSIGARRQDMPGTEEEIPNDPGAYNYYNDRNDWDVRVPMVRTDPNLTGTYDPGFTMWYPQPDATYTTGFFNPNYFPSLGPISN